MSNRILLADTDKKNLAVLSSLIEEMYDIRPSICYGLTDSFYGFVNDTSDSTILIRIDDPLIQGVEMSRQARSYYPVIQVVWMSVSEGYAIDAFPQGVDAYLLLPATRKKMDAVMEALKFKRRRCEDTG